MSSARNAGKSGANLMQNKQMAISQALIRDVMFALSNAEL